MYFLSSVNVVPDTLFSDTVNDTLGASNLRSLEISFNNCWLGEKNVKNKNPIINNTPIPRIIVSFFIYFTFLKINKIIKIVIYETAYYYNLKFFINSYKYKMKVAIIGGGPVGLYTALLLRNHTVTLFEKRSDYIRNQIFLIQRNHFDSLPVQIRKNMEKYSCFINNAFTTTDAGCFNATSRQFSFSCRISDFEKELKTYLKQFKTIEFITKNVSNNQIRQLMQDYDIIIGADGRDSIVGKEMSLDKTFYPNLTRQGLGVIFTFTQEPKQNKRKFSQHLFRGFKTKNGHGYLGVRLISSNTPKKEVDRLIHLGLKYYGFEGVKISSVFSVSVTPFFRQQVISKTKSKISISKTSNKLSVLVGDSAVGVDYFTGSGVNFGFDMAKSLVKHLKKNSFPNKLDILMKKYTQDYIKISSTNLIRLERTRLRHLKNVLKMPNEKLLKIAKRIFKPELIPFLTHQDLSILLYDIFYPPIL